MARLLADLDNAQFEERRKAIRLSPELLIS
jgi:hypothetical protein